MRRHAVTADKNCIPINTHESRFSKSIEQIKSKTLTSLLKGFSKHWTAKILVSRFLGLSLQKLRSENPNLVPRVLSLLRESTLVTAGHVSARF